MLFEIHLYGPDILLRPLQSRIEVLDLTLHGGAILNVSVRVFRGGREGAYLEGAERARI